MQMLPGMREVVSPFRQYGESFDGTQHTVGLATRFLPPQKESLSVVLNRGAFDRQIKRLSFVVDVHGGLYEPGKMCTSLHGPRCNIVKKRFASAVGYQIFAPPQTNFDNNPVINKVAEEHLKGLLGANLLRRVKQAGLLQKDGVHYRVPDSVLPRYDVSGAGTAVANGQYVARQVHGYVGPVIFKQETPAPSSRVLARHNGRWELIDIGPDLDQWDRPLSTLYAFHALEGGERPPVIGSWDIESGQRPGPTLQYIEPALGGAMSEPYVTSSVQRATHGLVEREAQLAQFSRLATDPTLAKLGNVTLYSGPRCTGEQRTITAMEREPLCMQCFDTCAKEFENSRVKMHDEVSRPHSKVASLRVMASSGGQVEVHTYFNCHGTWNYGPKEPHRTGVYRSSDELTNATKHNGCVDFAPSDTARPVHFVLHARAVAERQSSSSEDPVGTNANTTIQKSTAATETRLQSLQASGHQSPSSTQGVDAVDRQASASELSAAIVESAAQWQEDNKTEVIAAAQALQSVDAELAVEMVADRASSEMMRHLAQKYAASHKTSNITMQGTSQSSTGDDDGSVRAP